MKRTKAGIEAVVIMTLFYSLLAAGTATIDSTKTYQTIDGFGASSQWVESKINASLATQFWANDSVNGHAGLSIIRLGVDDSGNGNWGTACNSAKQALAINPNVRVFASPWSPPAKWKNNNATTGNNTGNSNGNPGSNTNQINTSHYSDYATYLTNFVKACKSTYGFDLYALSVQNEPDYDTSYDSCLWSPAMFDTFIGTYLGPALQTAGYPNIIMMPESFACNMNMSATTMADANAAKYVRVIGEHLYGGGPNPIPASYSTTAGHQVAMWQTEYSMKTSTNDITSGIFYANSVHKCIVDNNYNAYCYWWLVLSSGSDDEGLCDASGNPTKRLYTLGNYSKFVRPGYVRIGATETPASGLSCSAYMESSTGKFAIVVINQNTSTVSQQFSLTGLTASSVTPWLTDANNNLVAQTAVAVSGNSFTYTIPAQCVISFVGAGAPANTPTNTPYAGTPTFTPTQTATPHSVMLDDMEDGNNINNWGGNWYNYSGTGTTITPIPYVMTAGGMTTSPNYRAEIQATVADYAGLGTNLNSAQTGVDLTQYTAVQFYVKGNAGTYWFQFTQPSITDGDNFGVTFTAPTAWTLVTVPINAAALAQRGFGTASTFTPNAIAALQWSSNSNGALDIQIDNVQFLTSMAMTPTNTATFTVTSTSTVKSTATSTATATRTSTSTSTSTATTTATATATATQTSMLTITSTAISTAILTATPTVTSTAKASYTNTATITSTGLQTQTYTATLTFIPSFTLTATPQPSATNTFPAQPTSSATATVIQQNSATSTADMTATATATQTQTAVISLTRTTTVTPSLTFTPTGSNTATKTSTVTLTTTPSATITPTNTPTRTVTATVTSTFANTFTATPTLTAQPTVTATYTATADYGNVFKILNPVFYPNPYSNNGQFNIRFDLTKPADKILLKIFTSGFRLVFEATLSGQAAGKKTMSVFPGEMEKLSSGTYYAVISAQSSAGEHATSKASPFIMLK
jgi:glucuronoarabinoxylan endo-1,4-beta-xylanase